MTTQPPLKPFVFGANPVLPVSSSINRLSALVWGPAGCGKTVLASTFPGKKLWLQFDPDATASIGARDDIEVVDFSAADHGIVEQMIERGSYEQDFERYFKEREVDTVVFDSATSFSQKALTFGIVSGKADGKGFRASLAQPGISGYGLRNRYTLGAITMLLRLTAKYKKHFVVLCHEDTPSKDADGNIVSITILLGGSLPQEVALQISEVWHMKDTGKPNERLLRIRPFGVFQPMRSRMFDMTQSEPIIWNYDQATGKGHTVAAWYEAWRSGGFKKLPLPK